MAAEIEKVLKEKCSVDPTLELLYSQWVYDKRLVGQALQTVGNTFPHYSRHDASHSITILIQITRVLGERIKRLSATDLWMLLEAAYWHDMGMVVDDETIREWWSTPEFERHLTQLSESADDVLAAAARLMKDEKLRCKAEVLDIRQAAMLVIADYARGKHADRSTALIDNPLSLGLQSPRVLIPPRLFRWIGQIANSHGKSEDFVNELPQEESGLGTDSCHPRFVACMLRLGDLLDLDNGRFCPVLASTVTRFPSSSLAHVGKHASIQRLCVSPEKIEVVAVCDSRVNQEQSDPYAVFEAAETWLVWLKQELQYLASHWTDIAPPDFGGAPSIGIIEARLTDYVRTKDGGRPKFKIDELTFFELIRSNRLYEEQHAWMRELIANADDATRIRAFVENEMAIEKLMDRKDSNPLEELALVMQKYPIRITVKTDKEQNVRVSVEDHGTGISSDDLEYILTIGSSKRNPKRRQTIGRMPECLQPTGAFGLGLQSLFMVTDCVTIVTNHFANRDQLQIVLRRKRTIDGSMEDSPSGNSNGSIGPTSVYARTLTGKRTDPGTCIQFDVLPQLLRKDVRVADDAIRNPDKVKPSVIEKEKNKPGFGEVAAHPTGADPILEEVGGLDAAYLEELVRVVGNQTLAPIFLNGKPIEKDTLGGSVYFSHKANCAVRFLSCGLLDNPIVLRYRGIKVPNHSLQKTGLIQIEVDLHFGDASTLLTASRDSLTPYGTVVVAARVKQAIEEVFGKYYQLRKFMADVKGAKKSAASRSVKMVKKPTKKTYLGMSEAERQLACASMYAYLYLGWNERQLGESFQSVPLGDGVEYRMLVGARSFNLLLSFFLENARSRGQFALRLPMQNWVVDALCGLGFAKELLSVSSGHSKYSFSKRTLGETRRAESRNYSSIMRGIILQYTNFDGYVRPLFPSLTDIESLSLDYRTLPQWTFPRRLILDRQIISPFEFQRQVMEPGVPRGVRVRLSHLRYYKRWLTMQLDVTQERVDAFHDFSQAVKRFTDYLLETELDLLIENTGLKFSSDYVDSVLGEILPPT